MYFRTGNPKGLTESGSGELGIIVCGRVPWLYQYWPGGFMLFVVLCPGSGFKASKTGKWLEVSSDRLGELGIDDTFKRFRLSMHILTIKYL